jgi:gamma-glutamyl phosphate reductase
VSRRAGRSTEGLVLERVTCPLGVLGVVFEARPEALAQITGLGWKSGRFHGRSGK